MSFTSDLYSAGMGGGGPRASVGDEALVLVTPTRFRADLERTRSYVDALARDVGGAGDRLPQNWRLGWADFVTRWGGFVNDHPPEQDIVSSFTSSAWYTILGYADEARKWRASFELAGGVSTAVPDTAPRRPESLNPLRTTASPFVWVGLGAAVLLGVMLLRGGGGQEG